MTLETDAKTTTHRRGRTHPRPGFSYRVAFRLLVAAFLVLALPAAVLGDYSILPEKGGNNRNTHAVLGSGDLAVSVVSPPNPNAGQLLTQPVVMDANDDGNPDIFIYQGSNIISVLSGADPSFEQAAIYLGEPANSPAACDLDGDGTLEYVGVFEESGTYRFASVGFSGSLVIEELLNLTVPVNQYGNVACAQFYKSQGDTKYYALFVDTAKNLHILTDDGTLSHDIIDVDNAVAFDYENSDTITWGQFGQSGHTVLVSDYLDPEGRQFAVFTAGNHLCFYGNDGYESCYDFSSDITYATTMGPLHIHLVRGPSLSAGSERVALIAAPGTASVQFNVRKYRLTPTFFSVSPAVDGALATWNRGGTFPLQVHLMSSVSDVSGEGWEDIVFGWYLTNEATNFNLGVVYGNNMSVGSLSTGAGPGCGQGSSSYSGPLWMMDIDSDADKDAVFSCLAISGTTAGIYYAALGDALPVTIQELVNFSVASSEPHNIYPVDFTADGFQDFIFTNAANTRFLVTSVAGSTVANYPFTVVQNGTVGNDSYQKVTALFNHTGSGYNYGLVCDITSENLYSDVFRIGYNNTLNDVASNLDPMSAFLGPNGVTVTLGGNLSYLNLGKSSIGYRDFLTNKLTFADAGNVTYTYVSFSDDGFVTSYWVIDKNGTNLTVYERLPGVGDVPVGSVTLSSATVTLTFTYSPRQDGLTLQEYFDVVITANNATVGSTDTLPFDGHNLADTDLYTESTGTHTVVSWSLARSANLEPTFTEFQNGVRTVISGVTFEVASPQGTLIVGDGYSVIPDYNEQFFSVCEYLAAGTYTQRHYVAPSNQVDYTNYKDVTITVTGVTSGFGEEGVLDSSDAMVQGLEDLLLGFGWSSTGGKLMFWMLLTFIGAAWAFAAAGGAFGVVFVLGMFIIGVMVGFLPTWIAVVMIILAAAAAILLYQKVFAGGD